MCIVSMYDEETCDGTTHTHSHTINECFKLNVHIWIGFFLQAINEMLRHTYECDNEEKGRFYLWKKGIVVHLI